MATRVLAGLNVHVVGEPDATRVHSLVILLHGYGAPGTDLVSLAGTIAAPPGTLFLFPEAPIYLDQNTGSALYEPSRAWWPIDIVQLQLALASGAVDAMGALPGPGLAHAAELVAQMVVQATQSYQVPLSHVILGGFSQGAIVALEAALTQRWKLGGLLLFSGTLMDSIGVSNRASAIAPMSCVISHGQFDPILPFELAERLRAQLGNAGWDVRWIPFIGGHSIPPKATLAAGEFVTQQLS